MVGRGICKKFQAAAIRGEPRRTAKSRGAEGIIGLFFSSQLLLSIPPDDIPEVKSVHSQMP
jgi:hypothetical protein